MTDRFVEYIEKENLCASVERILVAVSGGADSVMLADLFHKAGYDFAVAHCNFHLRGEESDNDEAFVKKLSDKYGVKYYCKHFQTEEYSKRKGISIEMAARELRYEWFEEIRAKEGYDYTATAHHLDDEAETLFINLLRGTGIAGLHGILPKKEKLIRPLLFVYKNEITSYCKENSLDYREDSSNASMQHIRNIIRHKIIPELREINPSLMYSLKETIRHLKETEEIFDYYVDKKRQKIVTEREGKIYISIAKLKQLKPLNTYLHEFLIPYGFNNAVVKEIINALDEQPGKLFFSPTHRLIKDRYSLIIDSKIKRLQDLKIDEVTIAKDCQLIILPIQLRISKHDYNKDIAISKEKNIATLDLGKVKFPLTIRKWKQGDYFYPFGMSKKKKVSRFLIDEKLSLAEKENIYVICSEDKILWITGQRTDNRFRVTENTKEILRIEYASEKIKE